MEEYQNESRNDNCSILAVGVRPKSKTKCVTEKERGQTDNSLCLKALQVEVKQGITHFWLLYY